MSQIPMSLQLPHAGFDDRTRDALNAPMDKADVRQDVVVPPDDFRPRYPAAPAVIRRLNAAFNHAWSDEILKVEIAPDRSQVTVHVRITAYLVVGGQQAVVVPITHEAIGQCRLKTNSTHLADYGYDVKAAQTDAIRKAATKFGISLELYEKDEAPFQGNDKPTVPAVAQPAPDYLINQVCALFENQCRVSRQQWCEQLKIADPSQLTTQLATSIISGQHPLIIMLSGGQYRPPAMSSSNA